MELACVKITPLNEAKRFRFRLEFSGSTTPAPTLRGGGSPYQFRVKRRGLVAPQPIEFEMSASEAMGLLAGLQVIQATHKLPLPAKRPARGRPNLVLVKTDNKQ